MPKNIKEIERKAQIQRIRASKMTEPVRVPNGESPQLQKLTGIRAVVFDVYGTLISSGVGDISLASQSNRDASLRASLVENGFKLSDASHAQALDQRLNAIICKHQAKRRSEGVDYPEVEIRSVWQDLIHTMREENWIDSAQSGEIENCVIDYECRVNPTQAMPNLLDALQTIQERGLMMSIISNAQFYTELLFEAWANQSIESLNFSPACNVWSYQELIAKPSAQLYTIAANRLFKQHAIDATEVLYIGNDMRNDIWPAQKIGFKTALFAGDERSLRRRENDPDCTYVVPDLVLTDLAQIIDCLV
jgi:putative hydrolase of the HAD superfamily